jgi:hypothetical protein
VLHQAADLVAECLVIRPAVAGVLFLPPVHQQANGGGPVSSQRSPAMTIFRNGTGILRNISAANDAARRHLRAVPRLVDCLLDTLRTAAEREQVRIIFLFCSVSYQYRNPPYRNQNIFFLVYKFID